MLSKENSYKAIEIMLEQGVRRINKLNDLIRQCIYEVQRMDRKYW